MSIDPKAPPEVLEVTIKDAALCQLETAILLWFQYGDPVSIHTLAAAACGCYHAIGDRQGMPTVVETFRKSLPKKKRWVTHSAQNFFKHGPERGRPTESFRPEEAELFMIDSTILHERLFTKRTPLMSCFFARISYENPALVKFLNTAREQKGLKELKVYDGIQPDRVKFLGEVLPVLTNLVV